MIQNHKKIKMGKCTQKFNQWDTKKPKNSFEEIVFLKKKLRMALKQEIIVKLVRIWVEHPTFWRIEKKSKLSDCLFWSHPNSYQESKKSTSYTVNDRETKNSWRFVSAYIFHSKIGIFLYSITVTLQSP